MSEFSSASNVKERIKVKKPPLYKVLMINDHYSTMEFVVEVLTNVFHKLEHEAQSIMLDVHKKGKGLCGVYSREIAETKIEKAHQMASSQGHPLKCQMELE